jgi:hypothetical protein
VISCFFEYKNDYHIVIEAIKEVFNLYQAYAKGLPIKGLISFGTDTSIHPEARQYAKKVKMPAIAQAFIILNLAQRISATFYHLLRS